MEIGANKERKELPNAVIELCHKVHISYSYVISFVIYSDDVLYFCSTMKKKSNNNLNTYIDDSIF